MRRYTFKLYPNAAQGEALENMRALHSGLYNGLLQQRIEAYQRAQWTLAPQAEPRAKRGVTLTYYDQCKELTALRAEMPEYAALSSGSMAATAQRVDRAFQAFFRRAKAGAGASAGFPRYKRCDGFGFKKHNSGWSFTGNRLRLQAVPGLVKARGKYPAAPEQIKTCDLTLIGGTWWISVVVVMSARMRCDAAENGEVEFDLIDSFARVRREDGGCVAGPEETVYAAADGRITPVFAGCYAEADAITSQTRDDRRISQDHPGLLPDADTQQTQGERGGMYSRGPRQPGATTPQMGAERGVGDMGIVRCPGATTSQMQDDRRGPAKRSAPLPGAGAPQMQGDSGQLGPANSGAAALQTRSDRREDIGVIALDADAQQTQDERRLAALMVIDHADMPQMQRAMSRCKRGSCKYRAAKRRHARAEARRARQRREALHLWTTALARRFARLTIICPPIVEATKSGAGDQREWGAMVAVKADMNKRVLQQAPATAIQMLSYKITERGGTTETEQARNSPVMAGNLIVEAAKANRKLRRTARA